MILSYLNFVVEMYGAFANEAIRKYLYTITYLPKQIKGALENAPYS
jgi:hypothetical protein